MVSRYSIVLYAHAELENHYHILIESPEGNVSQALQWLNTSYSVWFNNKHGRSGALFQNRFKSIPVEKDAEMKRIFKYDPYVSSLVFFHSMEGHINRLSLDRVKNSRCLLALSLLPAICLLYRHTLLHTFQSFTDPLGSMTHGWLIPILSICTLWRQRAPLQASGRSYSLIGFFGVLVSLGLFWIGNKHSLLWLQQLSFINMLWSLTYTLWGREVAKLTMFPIWYLAFAVSIPSVLEDLILQLQQISSTSSFYLMRGFCFEVFQEGNNLFSPVLGSEFHFNIAGACSGIRSLLALTAFTALYAWYSQKTVLRKWLLFICSVPIAVICNITRVFSICLVAAVFGQDATIGYYHDYSGYVIALIAILLIFKTGSVISSYKGIRSWAK